MARKRLKLRGKLTIIVENIPAVSPTKLHVCVEVAQQLDYLRHVVVVFAKDVALALRIEEILRRQQLEDDACRTPNVRRRAPVRTTKDSLWRPILSRLDILGIMLHRRRRISEVGNLDGYRQWRYHVRWRR